jgi:1-aminocyclopropane-1-carboxylate deaminase/D-cysteine desulfhydrase-like pyridoxal-dependent ACC family enzyme
VVTRALFDRLPRLADLVPFTPLADGLPTPVEQVSERLWVKRDDLTDSHYGGNKVRKLEHLLPIAQRRGGPVLTAGAIGSHHVVATAVHARRLGLEVEAVQFPQPDTDHVREVAATLPDLGVRITHAPSSYAMPAVLAARLAALAPKRPLLILPGGSTPLGVLGHVGAGLELAASGTPEPDAVVVALGSGGSTVGLAIGLALGGWRRARVVGARTADVVVTNALVLRGLEAATAVLLAFGGARPGRARFEVDGRWFGPGYGHPTAEGDAATKAAAEVGITVEPTYTAKSFACALDRVHHGERVVWIQTHASWSVRQ